MCFQVYLNFSWDVLVAAKVLNVLFCCCIPLFIVDFDSRLLLLFCYGIICRACCLEFCYRYTESLELNHLTRRSQTHFVTKKKTEQ